MINKKNFCNRFVNEYGFMEPMIFATFFTRMIYESLRDGSVWDGTNFYWWSSEHERSTLAISQANFLLEFTSHIRGFKDILISVDLVPAIDIPVNVMPKLTNQLSCPSSIAEKGHLYVLLMKGNEKLHKTSQSVRSRFRVSTSFLEREIIKKFPAEIRKAYMLLKILNSNLVDFDYMSNQFFRTYLFKTALPTCSFRC